MKVATTPLLSSVFASGAASKSANKSLDRSSFGTAAPEDRVRTSGPVTVTYGRSAAGRSEASIARLMQDAETAHQRLKDLVAALLRQQGITLDRLKPADGPMRIDGDLQGELEALLGPDGDLGVEATSDRIIAFARALSGGDPSRGEELRKAIIQGFREAEDILGELPDISRKTYDRVMEKLDAWIAGTP